MRARQPPRYQGKITAWKDEQGYGFISPNGGGPAVFVHVCGLAGHAVRPAVGAIVTYHLATNDKGQSRAANVAFVDTRRHDDAPSAAPGGIGFYFAGAFLVFIGLSVYGGRLPLWLGSQYALASAAAVLAYGFDKEAARAGRRRTPEKTLHLLALVGGWPGALLAQHLFRHKTRKESFRSVFRLTVVVNCAVLGYAMSHLGPVWLRPVG